MRMSMLHQSTSVFLPRCFLHREKKQKKKADPDFPFCATVFVELANVCWHKRHKSVVCSLWTKLSHSTSSTAKETRSSKYLKKKHHYVSEDKVETETITGVSCKLLVQTVKFDHNGAGYWFICRNYRKSTCHIDRCCSISTTGFRGI